VKKAIITTLIQGFELLVQEESSHPSLFKGAEGEPIGFIGNEVINRSVPFLIQYHLDTGRFGQTESGEDVQGFCNFDPAGVVHCVQFAHRDYTSSGFVPLLHLPPNQNNVAFEEFVNEPNTSRNLDPM